MAFTKEQKKEAYRKLSPEVQNFIMDSDTTDLITSYLNESGLTEEQSNLADSEILYAMYGLQTLDTVIGNIAKLSNKSPESLHKLKLDLEDNIFANLQKLNSEYSPPQISQSEDLKTKSNGVGDDFERMVMNQARAMRPAVEAPSNLPGEELQIESSEPRVIHNYKGEDPYRETPA